MNKRTAIFLAVLTLTLILTSGCRSKSYYDPNLVNATLAPTANPVIVLEVTELTIEVGESYKINANVENEPAEGMELYVKSTDEAIVTVQDDGKILGVGVGTAEVIVSNDDMSISASFDVTVTDLKKAVITSNVPNYAYGGYRYSVEIKFENCREPWAKIVTNCAYGTVTNANGSTDFENGEQQLRSEGDTTLSFVTTGYQNPNTIRILCYDGDEQIDTKEYTINIVYN